MLCVLVVYGLVAIKRDSAYPELEFDIKCDMQG